MLWVYIKLWLTNLILNSSTGTLFFLKPVTSLPVGFLNWENFDVQWKVRSLDITFACKQINYEYIISTFVTIGKN
jgi:hypothetical protein